MKPTLRPSNPCFSSGPCAKRPGWSVSALEGALVGRSHRSKEGRARIQEVLDRSRALLGVPADYRIGIVPASDTGAVEMALWSLLGPLGVDALAWESFGQGWVTDIVKQLKLPDVRVFSADYGQIADLSAVDDDRDVVFTWNGTTSGVRVPDADWIPDPHEGLFICDATSAVFAMDVPIAKLDVVTYSWQKVLGGEGQHGVLILSPRAVERLESYQPSWPLPKIFRMTKGGKLIEGIFKADTINTPSMLCVEDALDGLKWAEDDRWASRVGPQEPGQSSGRRRVGGPHALGGLPSRRPGDPFQHVHLPQDGRPLVHGSAGRGAGESFQAGGVSAGGRRRGLRHRLLSGCAPGITPLGRSHRAAAGPGSSLPLAGLGLRAGQRRIEVGVLFVVSSIANASRRPVIWRNGGHAADHLRNPRADESLVLYESSALLGGIMPNSEQTPCGKGAGPIPDAKVLNRRDFLRIAGLSGAAIALGGGLGGLVAACGETGRNDNNRGSIDHDDGRGQHRRPPGRRSRLPAAAATTPAPGWRPGREIKVGFVTPLTGPIALFGVPDQYCAQRWNEAVADGLGMRRRQESSDQPSIVRDSQSDTNRAAQVAGDLINNDKVDVIMAASTPDTVQPGRRPG